MRVRKFLSLLLAMLLAGNVLLTVPVLAEDTEMPEEETELLETEQDPERLLRDDYYQYVNEEALQDYEIPEDYPAWSEYYELNMENEQILDEELHYIVENADQFDEGSNERKIAAYYQTFLDEEARENAGFGPFQSYIDAIRGAGSVQEYMEELGTLGRETLRESTMNLGFMGDFEDSSVYCPVFREISVGLGASTYDDESESENVALYQQYITDILTEAGYSSEEAEKNGEEILNFMEDIAQTSLDLVSASDPSVINNAYSKEEFQELFSNFDTDAYLKAADLENWDHYIVQNVQMAEAVNAYLTEENLEMLKAYSIFRLATDLVNNLTLEIMEIGQNFDAAVDGTEAESLEELASDDTSETFAFELGEYFVEENFSEEAKEDITAMTERIIDKYRERIQELDWMSDETKEGAIKKLDAMTLKIGYPDEWPNNYDDTQILSPEEGGTLIDNIYSILRTTSDKNYEIYSEPVDRSAWTVTTPQTVNAFYYAQNNEIIVPAGFLQDPYYDPDMSEAEKYGSIGMVIGHEITHAFDLSGAQYDEYGNVNLWWTEEDLATFMELAQNVVDYFNGIELSPDLYVNGDMTVNENIADLGGLTTVASFFEGDAESLDELFRAFAKHWLGKYTEDGLEMQVEEDTHSPDFVRVNAGLSTLESFYETYPEIQEGDGMYVAPEDRVRIW